MTDEFVTLNLDRIVELLHAQGHTEASVEQTGGGTATIYAGPLVPHKEYPDIETHAIAAGPGWFEGPWWTNGRATSDEFFIGRNNEFEGAFTDVPKITNEEEVANLIAAAIRDFQNNPE